MNLISHAKGNAKEGTENGKSEKKTQNKSMAKIKEFKKLLFNKVPFRK